MLYIILPAYNEARGLEQLFSSIEKTLTGECHLQYKIIFVDDGSTDETGQIANKKAQTARNIEYIGHLTNKGLGAALQTAFNFIFKNLQPNIKEDIAITMDADNTHPTELIPQMVSEIKNNGCDIVIASRFVEGGKEFGVPFHRKILSRGAKIFLRLFLRNNTISAIRDFTSGYRAYSIRTIFNALHHCDNIGLKLITENGFAAGTELLFKLIATNAAKKIKEIPLPLRYDLKTGPSKIKLIPTILGYLRTISKLVLFTSKKQGAS